MPDDCLLDQVVGDRYQVLNLLGEGAMGAVYLAQDTRMPRKVALKILRKEWASRPDVRRRVENECGIMAVLGTNQHIVTLYDRLEHDGSVILVMEYVPGETLADICDRTRTLNSDDASSRKTTPVAAGGSVMVLDEHDAISVVCQCLEGLGFAHSKGIIHRDIKPSNIMVMRDHKGDLVAKIMDFGIGKALSSGDDAFTSPMLTAEGGPGPGTPAYMAPEQIDSKRFGPVTPAADLYSLGVTLYGLLTFSRPFEGTYTELIHAHTSIEPPDPRTVKKDLSPQLAAVVLKALRKNPRERHQSAAEFKYDLEAAKVTSPIQAEEPKPKRNWLPALLAGMAGLFVVIAVAMYLYKPIPPPAPQELKIVYAPPMPKSILNQGEPLSFVVNVEGREPSKIRVSAPSLPEGGSFDPNTRQFQWPGNGGPGSKKVVFHAEDSSVDPPLTDDEEFKFEVQPQTPPPPSTKEIAFETVQPQTVLKGQPLEFVLNIKDSASEDMAHLSFAMLNETEIPGAHFDTSTRKFLLDTTATPPAPYVARFSVQDKTSESRKASINCTIDVKEPQKELQKPQFKTVENPVVKEGETLSVTVEATDPNSTGLNYQCTDKPDWVQFDPASRTLSGTAPLKSAGQTQASLEVSDNSKPTPQTGYYKIDIVVRPAPLPHPDPDLEKIKAQEAIKSAGRKQIEKEEEFKLVSQDLTIKDKNDTDERKSYRKAVEMLKQAGQDFDRSDFKGAKDKATEAENIFGKLTPEVWGKKP